jgi:hypothetical protein
MTEEAREELPKLHPVRCYMCNGEMKLMRDVKKGIYVALCENCNVGTALDGHEQGVLGSQRYGGVQ